MMRRMIYKAKIDWWIGASILAGLAIPTALVVFLRIWNYGALPLCIALLVFGWCIPQSYEAGEKALIIHSGFYFRRDIPYDTITALRHSTDSRSAMALSLDRIEIEYTKGKLLIAPKEQEAFMEELSRKAPQLSRKGFDLVAL